MKERHLTEKIVEWYQQHQRALPWRKTQDPYKIWLSEIILQQTRVAQGLPYYQKFIRRFPSIRSLAAAPEREILRIWQGLGYYSRARNLKKCANQVVDQHRGRFPKSFAELRKLPGIGDYTAAAIASFAHDEAVAVVDGNVFRVLARLFGLEDDILSSSGKKKFAKLANQLMPEENPGLYNQAIMEFGALHCTPHNPKCGECPLQSQCIAFRNTLQLYLPVKRKPSKSRHRYFYYFAMKAGDRWLMKERASHDIWMGLFDFPLYEETSHVKARQMDTLLNEKAVGTKMTISSIYRHVLTHQVIHARFVTVSWPDANGVPAEGIFTSAKWFTPRQIGKLPKPVLIGQFLRDQGVL